MNEPLKVGSSSPRFQIDYGEAFEREISILQGMILRSLDSGERFNTRWLAIKLLEGESDLADRINEMGGGPEILQAAENAAARLESTASLGIDIALADRRYTYIREVLDASLRRPEPESHTISSRIDQALTTPWIGIPVFLVIMYFVFSLVVNVSAPYLDWIDSVISGPITRWIAVILGTVGAPDWLEGLILDGIVPGVGGVLVFLPGLIVLFLFIAILEDSGYLARAAVVMDRFLGFAGLRGKSFVSLILGFGCAVPAIYATRTLEDRRERILTGLLVPFMSCAARMPVYIIFGLAFFSTNANIVIWGLYVLGILVAGVTGWIFSHTLFKRKSNKGGFVMELPSFRWPTIRSLRFHIEQRVSDFLRNAGTMILLASVVIWALLSFPSSASDLEESYFGQISSSIAPVFEPAGFGTWETTGALLTGTIAKEIVVSTMSQIYLGEDVSRETTAGTSFLEDLQTITRDFAWASVLSGRAFIEVVTPGIILFEGGEREVQDPALSQSMQYAYSPISALAVMVFVLLYVPCVATLGAMRSEFGGRWAAFAAVFQFAIAWLMAVAVFQIGSMLFGL